MSGASANNSLLIAILLVVFGSLVARGLIVLSSGSFRTRRGAEFSGTEVAAPGVLSLAIGLIGVSCVLYSFVFGHSN